LPPAFSETPELGVFTSGRVVNGREPVCLVFHHENGDWEFVTGDEQRSSEICLIHVGHIIEWDPSIAALADLPSGWKAWRESPASDWAREPTPPAQPTFEE
jgi:hypothetical protein